MYVAKRIVRILTVSQAQWSFPLKNQIPKRLLSLTASKFHGDYEYQVSTGIYK
ncbi:unnamed protein product [Haemonchus placei]|uniref:KTSC domain-containing protein n=1 Tax=Haemonchus placei TaxID=6290 RepID=A0A0N4VX72_HAEPC|nr:unnamed protein product [Haemonchus placei]